MLIILYAFGKKLHSDPMEIPDEHKGSELVFSLPLHKRDSIFYGEADVLNPRKPKRCIFRENHNRILIDDRIAFGYELVDIE